MPLGSVTYENNAFLACYGDAHAASWPASFTVHLFEDNPGDLGLELAATTVIDGVATSNGYAPQPVANTTANFPPPVAGMQSMVYVTFTATAAWPATARYAGLKDPSGVLVEYVELAEPITVLAAGDVRVPLDFWHNDIEE